MDSAETDYQQALDYLYSFIDYSLTRSFRYTPDKFHLGRMFDLLERLGNPHQQYRVIHIAGTKGKGSTAALIASSLHSAGYKTGFYTSPHLQEYTERIQVDGEEISRVDFAALVEKLKPHAAQVEQITTFELTTALAFMYFAQQQVDVAVVEVGLGGRLDATNVVAPLVSVITSLSYDHTAVLGNTLAEIAGEKAGIIKPGRPIVLAPQREEARLVVERVAQERAAPLTQVGRDYLFAPGVHNLDGQSLLVWSKEEQAQVDAFIESGGITDWHPVRLTIPLLGFHQVENAATAYTTLLVAREEGLVIPDAAIRAGFWSVRWPGRFEVLRRNPPVIVDSAHNRDSALKLRLALDDYLPGQPIILIFGASEDKDAFGMFTELMPRVSRVIATQSVHPRAMEPVRLVELAHQFGRQAVALPTVEAALEHALDLAGGETAVVITGSIFIAAAGREAWRVRMKSVNNRVKSTGITA